jgi:Protein of unknown function (DUF3303)
MLFMIIERFKDGDASTIGKRFKQRGRMLPEGVTYHASWVDFAGSRCFQVMEAPRMELLKEWMRCWEDLVEFEVVRVVTSAEFWAKKQID